MAEFLLGFFIGVVIAFLGSVKWLWLMAKALTAAKVMLDKSEKDKAEIQWRNAAILSTFEAETIKELKLQDEKKFMENVNKIMNGKHE